MNVTLDICTMAGLVRLSKILTILDGSVGDELEADINKAGRRCRVHGYLDDPIVYQAGGQIVVACPKCCSRELREMWVSQAAPRRKKEGPRSA